MLPPALAKNKGRRVVTELGSKSKPATRRQTRAAGLQRPARPLWPQTRRVGTMSAESDPFLCSARTRCNKNRIPENPPASAGDYPFGR
jgi:hypothetical protein